MKYTLSTPVETKTEADGTPHYIFSEEFTMKLEPSDDQKGYVVAEFRVNGDGWHHYYGWPDAPEGTPYKFTPRGTTIKELVYGSLSSEGLSPQPWEERSLATARTGSNTARSMPPATLVPRRRSW